jgi:hypothetical protein
MLFVNTFGANMYSLYAQNTIGGVESISAMRTLNQVNTLQATCVGGYPRYKLVNGDEKPYSRILPERGLYSPVVLSPEWYNTITHYPGVINIRAKCNLFTSSYGYDPEVLLTEEEAKEYGAKFKLNEKGFNYDPSSVKIDVVKSEQQSPTLAGSDTIASIEVDSKYYEIADGCIYFTKSLEESISEQYITFEDDLAELDPENYLITYNIKVIFPLEIADTNNETHALALAQATQYAVMEYFSQYEQARAISHIKAEIAYMETLTFYSTIMGAALTYFGSWGTPGGFGEFIGEVGAMVGKESVSTVGKTIMKEVIKQTAKAVGGAMVEVTEEVIKDAFIETLVQGYFVEILGMSEDIGFWMSSLATSVREHVSGPLGLMTKGITGGIFSTSNLNAELKQLTARLDQAKDVGNFMEQQQLEKQILAKKTELATKNNRKALLTSIFKGIGMFAIGLFAGSLSFLGGTSLLTGTASTLQYIDNKAKIETYNHILSHQIEKDLCSYIDREIRGTAEPREISLIVPSTLEASRQQLFDAFSEMQANDAQTLPQSRANKQHSPDIPSTIDQKAFGELSLEEQLSQATKPDTILETFQDLDKIKMDRNRIRYRLETMRLENYIKDIIKNQEKLFLAKFISPSMDPLFKVGTEVLVRISSSITRYKVGDFIAFNRDGVIILHQIFDTYMYKGKIYFVTGGLNPETNQYVDSTTISKDAIIGKVDLSERALKKV